MGVVVQVDFRNMTLQQLKDELARLCLAGFGDAVCGFRAPSMTVYHDTVTMRVYKPLPTAGESGG